MSHRWGAGRRAAAAAPLALALLAAAAPALAQDPADFPADAKVFVRGRGWGHGRGMGQWGAKGMAAEGAGFQGILKHYYTGIEMTKRDPEAIRVLIARGDDLVLTSESPLTAAWAGGETIAQTTSEQPYLRAAPTASGYRVDRGTSPGGPWANVASGDVPVVFRPGTAMLQLVFDNGSVRYYRGAIEARRPSAEKLYAVNDVDVEHYLYGVVPREMPASWEPEALKAQAVAARSYALNKKDRARERRSWYDICATTSCQVYGGSARRSSPSGIVVSLERAATNTAVNETAQLVMVADGTPIFAEFSSSTGGHTAPGSAPYLAAVPDPADAVSPHHDWTSRISAAEIEKRWPQIGRFRGLRVTGRNGYGQWGGRVTQMTLTGTAGAVTISGHTFRSAFAWPARPGGIRSNWFIAYYWDAELVEAPSQVAVPAGGAADVQITVRNRGNISWKVGGYVRLAAGSPRFADESWPSPDRAAAVSANASEPEAAWVRPGQVAAFRFRLSANDAPPGVYRETFRPIADGYSTMRPEIPLDVTVVPA